MFRSIALGLGMLFMFAGSPANAYTMSCSRLGMSYKSKSELQACVSELTGEVEDLQSEISSLRSEISSLRMTIIYK